MGDATRTRVRNCRQCQAEYEDPRTGRGRTVFYCSPNCRIEARREQIERAKLTYGPCEIESCEKIKRSRKSKWCEMHYGRNRSNGNPNKVRARAANGTCHHCGEPSGAKHRLFCSDVCRRRDRMGVSGRLLSCAVCSGDIPESARLDALFCSNECDRTNQRAALYGITGAELKRMLDATSGCQVCGDSTRDLVVDHCHTSGVIRGILCGTCNVGIGMFKDDPYRLAYAIKYLEGWRDGVGRNHPTSPPTQQLAGAS